jgi:hypothetical protein
MRGDISKRKVMFKGHVKVKQEFGEATRPEERTQATPRKKARFKVEVLTI